MMMMMMMRLLCLTIVNAAVSGGRIHGIVNSGADKETCLAAEGGGKCRTQEGHRGVEVAGGNSGLGVHVKQDGKDIPQDLDIHSRPLTPKLGDVMENLGRKVPDELPGWVSGGWSHFKAMIDPWMKKIQYWTAPHVEKLVSYGGEVLRPGEELAARCRGRRRKTATTTASRGEGVDAGLDACSLLDVSWSLGRQLANVGRNASAATTSWLAQEVPLVPIPLHLIWVEVDVDVAPITAQDVGSIILHQRPFWIIRITDWISEGVARFLHAIPLFDLVINARYDLFYWPDPACPLIQVDGMFVRAPSTPDGYCKVRPCARQSSVSGQNGKESPFCECTLPSKQCRLRAEPLRDFHVLVDGHLSGKPINAKCETRIAWSTFPEWLPEFIKQPLQGILPRYMLNLIIGVFLVWAAEPLSESRLIHYTLSAILGLFSGLIILALVLNYTLRTVHRLQPFSGLATFLTSAASILLVQRFGRESPFALACHVLQMLWADPKGQYLITGSAALGVLATGLMGWFKEPEDEARERGGWMHVAFNGQANIRKLLRLASLYALLHSCPNPDYGTLIVILFLLSDQLRYIAYRMHMYLRRSPDTRRFLSKGYVGGAVREGGGEKSDNHTAAALADLRNYVNANPQMAHRLSGRGGTAMDRFRQGAPHVWTMTEEDEGARTGGGRYGARKCCIQ